MYRVLRLGTTIALIGGMLLPVFSSDAAASIPGLPNHATTTYRCGTGSGATYHEATATVSSTVALAPGGVETIWNGIAIEGTRNSWFHIDLLKSGSVVQRWRGIHNSSHSRSAPVSNFSQVVKGAGSKLLITAFFANHTSCSIAAS